MEITRRNLLTSTVATIGLFGATSAFGRIEKACRVTPVQPEGPFYPVRDQLDKDNDLTFVEGHTGNAHGTIIYLQGVVSDSSCKPIGNAVVEIWQACATGRYNHPGDAESQSPLDSNFQYWGISTTNDQGRYHFKTIIPGHYKADADWIRPPHIHFKVHKLGYHELITQMYFAGNQYNDGDLILQKLTEEQKKDVIVTPVKRASSNLEEYDCAFNVTLTRVR